MFVMKFFVQHKTSEGHHCVTIHSQLTYHILQRLRAEHFISLIAVSSFSWCDYQDDSLLSHSDGVLLYSSLQFTQ